MAVRNFYIKARIDGRKTLLTGGPRSKHGGFDLTITQRVNGEIHEACTILARAHDDGTLTLRIEANDGIPSIMRRVGSVFSSKRDSILKAR